MSLTIKRIVNVQLAEQGQIAKNRDFSVIAILTDEACETFNKIDARYVFVSSVQDAATHFGSNSRVVQACKALFANHSIKKAVIAKWVKAERVVQATPNELRGSALSVGIHKLKVADASFKLNLGGAEKTYTGIDLSQATDFADIATKITAKVTSDNIKVVYDKDGNRFKIVATTAGEQAQTKLGYTTPADTGTYIGGMLNFVDGKADIIVGANSVTLPKEAIDDALDRLFNVNQNFYGIYSSVILSDEEVEILDGWVTSAQAPCVAGFTIVRDSQLEFNNTNVIKKIYNKNTGRFFAVFNNTGEEHAGLELLGKAVSTNWEGSNTAQTMKFKNLKTVQSDDRINLNVAEKCDRLGVNFYTDYDGVSMVAEGVAVGGKFIDEIVGLDAFNDRVQKEVFGVLKSAKKVPQTDKGQVRLIAAVKRVCEQFVKNGFIAPGQWRGDPVGLLETNEFLELGYYVYSPSYTEQLQSDREERKAVPINVAIKLAGAIHSVDILINYNR